MADQVIDMTIVMVQNEQDAITVVEQAMEKLDTESEEQLSVISEKNSQFKVTMEKLTQKIFKNRIICEQGE